MKHIKTIVFILLFAVSLCCFVNVLMLAKGPRLDDLRIVSDEDNLDENVLDDVGLKFDFSTNIDDVLYLDDGTRSIENRYTISALYMNGQVEDAFTVKKEIVPVDPVEMFNKLSLYHNNEELYYSAYQKTIPISEDIFLAYSKSIEFGSYKNSTGPGRYLDVYDIYQYECKEGKVEYSLLNTLHFRDLNCEENNSQIKVFDGNISILHGNDVYIIPVENMLDTKIWSKACTLPDIADDEIVDVSIYQYGVQIIGITHEGNTNYSINIYYVEHKTGEIIAKKSYKNMISEEMVEETTAETEHILVNTIAKTNYEQNYTILITKYGNHYNLIKIDLNHDKNNEDIFDLSITDLSEMRFDGLYMHQIMDSVYVNDTLYMCYVEFSDKFIDYSDNWEYRMIPFEQSFQFYEDYEDYKFFSGISIAVLRDGKMVYKGYVETDMAKGIQAGYNEENLILKSMSFVVD